jgi:catechol 2,3-dioxygenase-like lactoylglutathione lyase family enzyme
MPHAGGLRRIARNVVHIGAAAKFYAMALGFEPVAGTAEDAALAALLGVARVRRLDLRLGGQVLELTECFPSGAAYPARIAANDLRFQHIAIVSHNIANAYHKALAHGAVAITAGGPQMLPESSGGVTAWKFRDPDGHPLELLQFPEASERCGYDHTAISVSNVQQSLDFYTPLGLCMVERSLNHGVEQEALDGLAGAVVDVVALRPEKRMPHVELLHYRSPARGVFAEVQPADLAADRMVFATAGGEMALQRDPDGHFVLLEPCS